MSHRSLRLVGCVDFPIPDERLSIMSLRPSFCSSRKNRASTRPQYPYDPTAPVIFLGDLHLVGARHLLVPTPSPSSGNLHQRRTLVYGRVIDRLAANHRTAVLALPKHRGRIAPEISAVADQAARVGVLAAPAPVLEPARRRAASPNRFEERLDAQETRPLLEEAAAVAMPVAVTVTVTGRHRTAVGCREDAVGIQRHAGRRKGRRGRRVSDAVHVLERRHGTRHLDELDEHEHADPSELERAPEREGRGIRVRVEHLAEIRTQQAACIRRAH
ncbi:hypothetical protein SODALDRAFT_184745 [Sodiomyces alkalinus F11]|uniref:Uncharacterized protein n=1 Tax=Sodiomyces alkalinus (strain CBS 110278 / VKM F-3762 / F11) TaxID=1314773 RepID=A0A3N2PUS4_SODAK|nr:hypothetical protein SODALDRAFT_184745 [Sodiomyces alkalinus F11]ROT38241.1 hypothetical protein SODALDRAFT_184745 [Sodiomyces alkalinus F11]